MPTKVWFVTGASRGFGRIWTEAALARGDKVVATARDVAALSDISTRYGDSVLAIALDVTQRQAVFDAVGRGRDRFGRIDVLVNNAGYGQFGAVEEITEAEARAQIDTNLFGALWALQAALPIMRRQGSGHLLSVSSVGGVIATQNLGIYHASKWALEAINQSLAQEIAEFGLKVTLIEPAGYATDWSGSSAARSTPIPAYSAMRERRAARHAGWKAGDPKATAQAILQIVDSPNPPLRFLLGSVGLPLIREDYQARLSEWEAWNEVSSTAE